MRTALSYPPESFRITNVTNGKTKSMENSCPSCGVCSAVDGELARKMRKQGHATTEEVFVESRKFEEGTFELMVNPWPTKEFATLFAERWEKKSDSSVR
jgi:hypothetical protein